jgi:hypothetical protein
MTSLIRQVSTFGASHITKRIGGRQKVWVDAVQSRIAITSSMLADMKSVKMLGLSSILATKIQAERINETKRMSGFRWMICYKNIICESVIYMLGIVTEPRLRSQPALCVGACFHLCYSCNSG